MATSNQKPRLKRRGKNSAVSQYLQRFETAFIALSWSCPNFRTVYIIDIENLDLESEPQQRVGRISSTPPFLCIAKVVRGRYRVANETPERKTYHCALPLRWRQLHLRQRVLQRPFSTYPTVTRNFLACMGGCWRRGSGVPIEGQAASISTAYFVSSMQRG